jgi:hypothetical protein
MILNPLEYEQRDGVVRLQSRIEHSGKEEVLWYEVSEKYAQYLTTDRLDGFLVGVLLLAMKLGEDIEIRGAVSEKLYYNLTHYYTRVLRLVLPQLRPIRIRAERLDVANPAATAQGVATGFSAGVDSFCCVHDHLVAEVPPGFRLTHFVFNNVGSHGEWDGERARALFHSRYELVKGFPEELGLEFVKIDSNLSDVLKMNFEMTHVPRNVSAVLMLQRLFGRYYYSSAFRYEDCRAGAAKGIAYADPFALHHLSTETFDCISTGCQHTRVEKTRLTGLVPGAARWLNVCVMPGSEGKNCSKCWKCCRTLLTLELLGCIDDYAGVFDLRAWRRARDWYVAETILRKVDDPLSAEIREYAERIGYSFRLWQRVLGSGLRLAAPTIRAAKRRLGRTGTPKGL